MTFSSVVFLFMFFPITFILYAIIPNTLVRNIILAVASIVFYAFGEPVAVMIMIISIIFNY
nr:MBOAT family protein [Lachnospiraceae bacterium]